MSGTPGQSAAEAADHFEVLSLKDRRDLMKENQAIGRAAWPEFILHDAVIRANWIKLMVTFPEDQLSVLINGQMAAVLNAVPLQVYPDMGTLPMGGLGWGIEKALSDHKARLAPNALMGMQIVLAPDFAGQGLATRVTQVMVDHARARRLKYVVIPVRPNRKHLHPDVSMEDYVQWTREDGLPYDSWVRVHHRLGGKLIKTCTHSMNVAGTVAEWESWTGQSFDSSGPHHVPFALNPIEIDLTNDKGTYTEPNVWIVHKTGL